MSYIKRRKHAAPTTLALVAAGMALSPLAASAQDAIGGPSADDQTRTLGKVEVVGEAPKRYTSDRVASPKFTQPLVDTTQTIQVIGADLFNEQGATSLTEALRNSPGVGTFYAGENGNTTTGDTIYMRGFDSSSSIFVDGVRDLGSVSRDVFNLEQIEVAKGPAGTDNGRTAPTGAINLVSKQAFAEDAASAMVTIGTDSQRRATADWNHVLGENSAIRLNLMAQDSGVPGRDVVENKRWGLAPSLAFGLGTATRVHLNLLHIQQNNIPDGGVPTIGLPGYTSPDPARPEIGAAPPVDPSNFYGTLRDHDDVTVDMATVRVEHDISSDATLVNTTRWGRNEQDYLLTAFMLSADPARFITPDIDDPSTWQVARSLPTFKDQRNTILTNQANLRVHLGEKDGVEHDLSMGIELTREELLGRGLAAINDSAWPYANLYDPDPAVTGLEWAHNGTSAEGRTDTAAAYLFDTIKLDDRWQLNGGVRVDRYTTEFESMVVCGGRRGPSCGDLPAGTVVPGVDARDSDTLVSWKTGVLYKPTGNGSVYANYAISEQPPGGGSLELSNSENSANNPVFDPQEARTAEIGTKWNLSGDRLLVTAALYDTRVLNEVVQDPNDNQYYQTGEKRVRGVELSAVGSITHAWAVSAGYTTMDTEVVSGPVLTEDGTPVLTYTPKHAFTGWTTYTFGNGLVLGGGARYSDGLHRGSDGAIGTPTETESYWVFDAVASYAVNDRLTLRLNVSNVLDEEYVASINKSGYRYTPGAPRSALLTANFRF
ncbi:catecholate siderophore receptor Fiu [Luteimonas sp. 8-5]|uniref:catecholate siderophore receptor Fiu n=1 Tax=Luteimonas sp. 8-5 TaxID=3039387 RepID=UPI0024372BD6|nr:catecholate siderophore receptor Fiu [Luteimonas sp. 8-5]MDG6348208.1 catecholate siderophore receptor Fiu [Luteimonas sp. 8-5]